MSSSHTHICVSVQAGLWRASRVLVRAVPCVCWDSPISWATLVSADDWWFAVALSGAGFECVCVCVFPLRRARVFPAGVLLAAVDDLQERLPAAGRLGPRLWRGMGMHATQRTDAVSSGTDPAHHACGYTLKTSTLITHSDTFDPEVMLKKFLKMHF